MLYDYLLYHVHSVCTSGLFALRSANTVKGYSSWHVGDIGEVGSGMWRHSIDDVILAIIILRIQPHNKEDCNMCQLARSCKEFW